jgi:hypothetical protein
MADKKISALTAATTPLAGTEVLPVVQGGSTVKVSVANLTAGRSVSASNLLVQTDTGLEMVLVNQTSASGVALARVRLSHGSGASGVFEVGAGYGVIGLTTSGPFVFTTNSAERMRIEDSGNLTIANGNFVPATAGKGIDFSANTHAAGMTSELLNDYEEGTWTPAFAAWTTAPSVIFATYTKIGRQVTVTLYANDGVNAGNQDITGLPFTSSATSAGAAFGSSSEITAVIRGSVTQSSTNITNFPTNNLTGQFWQIVAIYFA